MTLRDVKSCLLKLMRLIVPECPHVKGSGILNGRSQHYDPYLPLSVRMFGEAEPLDMTEPMYDEFADLCEMEAEELQEQEDIFQRQARIERQRIHQCRSCKFGQIWDWIHFRCGCKESPRYNLLVKRRDLFDGWCEHRNTGSVVVWPRPDYKFPPERESRPLVAKVKTDRKTDEWSRSC